MGAVFGGKNSAAQRPNVSGIPVQTAVYGLAIPIAYGTNRISCNMIFLGGFQAHTAPAPGAGGGKGGVVGGGKGQGGTQTTYTADCMFALCEGPIAGIGQVWENSTTTSLSAIALTMQVGQYGQAPWSYIASKYPASSFGYSGIAWVGGSPLQLGTSPNMPSLNFEVAGILYGTAWDGVNAEPSAVVQDFLTNPHYGVGFPTTSFGEVHLGATVVTIPGSPFAIDLRTGHDMVSSDIFMFNLEVVDGSGNIFTPISGSPGVAQYAVTSVGLYSFNPANVGTSITIYYAFQSVHDQYTSFTRASSIGVSPVYDNQQQVSSMIEEMSTNTYSSLVWSSGVLAMVPRGTMSVTANGVTYTPPSQPIVDLGDDDFVENQGSGTHGSNTSDPIIVSRDRPADHINNIKLEAVDRRNQYAPVIVEVSDQGFVDAFGRRSRASSQVHFFTDVQTAHIVGQLLLQDYYIVNHYTFTTDGRYALLDPMDIVTLSQTSATNPISRQWVRISEITENDDGTFTFVAEEYPTGTGAAAKYSLNFGNGQLPDFNIDPGWINPPIFFIPPLELTNAPNPEIFIAVSGSNPKWGGCDIFISTDNNTYTLAGTQMGSTRMGAVTASNMANFVDPDNTSDFVTVNLVESFGQLVSASTDDANRFNSMCYMGGEVFSYTNARLDGPNIYTLNTYFRRGIYHTPMTNPPIGTGFFRIDNGVFILPIDKDQMNQTIYVKFCSFNIFGGHKQLISDVTPYTFVPGGSPKLTAPTNFAVAAGIHSVTLTWTNPPQRSLAGIEVWRFDSTHNIPFSLVAELGNNITNYTDGGLLPANVYTYRINAIDLSGNKGPDSAVIGIATLQVQQPDMGAASVPSAAFVPASISSTPIMNNAVSSIASVKGGTGLVVPNGTFGTVASISFTLDVAAVTTLLFSAQIFNDVNSNLIANTALWQLIVDGSVAIASLAPGVTPAEPTGAFSWSYPVSLQAGTHTSQLQFSGKTGGGPNASGGSTTINNPSITALALKR